MTISTLRHRLGVGLLGLVVVSLLVAPLAGVTVGATAAGSALTVEDADLAVDDTTTVPIRLSTAPNGLAGYDLRVSVADGSVATITDVTIADQYSLKNSSVDGSGTSAYASGVDLNDQVGSGASKVLLLSVTVKGVADGQTALRVVNTNVDNDDGNDVNPTLNAGTITVGTPDSTNGSESSTGNDTDGTGSGPTNDGSTDGSTNGSSTGGATGGSTGSTASGTSSNTSEETNDTQTQTDAGSVDLSLTTTDEGVNATVTDAANASSVTVDVPTNKSDPPSDAPVAVERLSLNVSGEDSQFHVTVGTPDDEAESTEPITESDVNAKPVGYFTMDTKNLSTSALDGARVIFDVNTSALANGSAAENVTLYRYHDGSWRALETTPLGNGTFAAETPGFSVFAVGLTQHAQVNETTTTTTQTGDDATTESSDGTTATPDGESTETTPTTTPGFGPITTVIGLAALGAALLARR